MPLSFYRYRFPLLVNQFHKLHKYLNKTVMESLDLDPDHYKYYDLYLLVARTGTSAIPSQKMKEFLTVIQNNKPVPENESFGDHEFDIEEFKLRLKSSNVQLDEALDKYYTYQNNRALCLIPNCLKRKIKAYRAKNIREAADKKDRKDYLAALSRIFQNATELIDYISNIRLALTIYNAGVVATDSTPYMIISVIWWISFTAPYLFAYSSGIQLLLNKNVFDEATYKNLSALKKFFLYLSLTFFGPLFFVFYYLMDVILGIINGFATVFAPEEKYQSIQKKFDDFKHSFGLNQMEYEGYLNQRSISQLMFESIPSLILNALIAAGTLNIGDIVKTNLSTLLFSFISTGVNICVQFAQLKLQSIHLQEDFLDYCTNCMKARFGWIPYLRRIKERNLNSSIDYGNLRAYVPILSDLLGIYLKISCIFTDSSVQPLITTFDIFKRNGERAPKIREIKFGESINKLTVYGFGQLIMALPPKMFSLNLQGIFWDSFVKRTRELGLVEKSPNSKWSPIMPNGQNLLEYCIDSNISSDVKLQPEQNRFPLENMMRELLSTGADLNSIGVTGESLLFYSIKNKKQESVQLLLEYGADPNTINSSDGKHALGVAVEMDSLEITKLLIQKGADPHKLYKREESNITFSALSSAYWNYVYKANKDQKQWENIIKYFLSQNVKAMNDEEKMIIVRCFARACTNWQKEELIQKAIEGIPIGELKDFNGNNLLHNYFPQFNNEFAPKELQEIVKSEEIVKMSREKNNDGETPLVLALKGSTVKALLLAASIDDGQLDCEKNKLVQILTNRLYDVAKKNENDQFQTIIQVIGNKVGDELTESLLKYSVALRNEPVLKYLVDSKFTSQERVDSSKLKYEQKEEKSRPIPEKPMELFKKALFGAPSTQKADDSSIKPRDVEKGGLLNAYKKDDTFIDKKATITQKLVYPLEKIIREAIKDSKWTVPKKQINLVEKIILFLLQTVALLDFIGDFIVLVGLVNTNNIGWISFTILTMMCPYLVSYAPLVTFFIERSQAIDKIHDKSREGFNKVIKVMLLTPFCLVYIFLLDLTYTILNITTEPVDILVRTVTGLKHGFIDIDQALDKILARTFYLSIMDAKGFKRLRSISQQIFESIPQIALQLRILNYGSSNFGITKSGLIFSIICAFIHGIFEIIIIYLESNGCKTSVIHYATICLNGRFNWVPFIEKFSRKGMSRKMDIIDYDDIHYKLISKKKKFHFDYRFSDDTMRILSESVGSLPQDANEPPKMNLGASCRDISLHELNLLVLTSYKRVIMDWDKVDFIPAMKKSIKDFKNPKHDSGELLIIWYAKNECQQGLIQIAQLGADVNVKSQNGELLLRIIFDKKMARALEFLQNYTDLNTNLIINHWPFGDRAVQSQDFEFLQAYLKFEKNQITFETRRQIVDAAKNYMLKDKKDIGFKILSYASGIHAKETQYKVLQLLVELNYDQPLDFYLKFEESLAPKVYIKFSNQDVLEVESVVAEKFRKIRILSNGIPVGDFSKLKCLGTQMNPYDCSFLNTTKDIFLKVISMVNGVLPSDINKEELKKCDDIIEKLYLDIRYAAYYELAHEFRTIKKLEINIPDTNVTASDAGSAENERGVDQIKKNGPFELPEDAIVLRKLDIIGYINDQGWGNTGASGLSLEFDGKRGQGFIRLLTIDRNKENASGDVHLTFDSTHMNSLINFRANGMYGKFIHHSAPWSGWAYECSDLKAIFEYFVRD